MGGLSYNEAVGIGGIRTYQFQGPQGLKQKDVLGWRKETISGITGIGSGPTFYQGQGQREASTFMNTGKKDLDLLLKPATLPFEPLSVIHVFSQKDEEINQAWGVDFYRRVFEKS